MLILLYKQRVLRKEQIEPDEQEIFEILAGEPLSNFKLAPAEHPKFIEAVKYVEGMWTFRDQLDARGGGRPKREKLLAEYMGKPKKAIKNHINYLRRKINPEEMSDDIPNALYYKKVLRTKRDWTQRDHERFLEAHQKFGGWFGNVKKIVDYIGTKGVTDVNNYRQHLGNLIRTKQMDPE